MKSILRIGLLLVLVGLGSSLGRSLDAATQLVVLGDSLSDRGNLFAFTTPPPPPLPSAFPPPPYADGRFSNGPVWVERLAELLGFPTPAPSLLGGTNYAWGGAETDTSGLSSQNTLNIGAQINGFPGVPGLFPAIPGYLQTNTPTGNELFVVWGGGNDFNNVFPTPAPQTVAANLAANLATLANAGALNFLVPNLPRLGQLPRYKGTPLEASFDGITLAFNAALSAELDGLQASRPELNITRFDVFSLIDDVLADPAAYGLANTMGTVKVDPTNFFDPRVQPNADDYMWFDDVHPTRVTHRILGDAAFAAVVPEPASWAVWCLVAGAAFLILPRSRFPFALS